MAEGNQKYLADSQISDSHPWVSSTSIRSVKAPSGHESSTDAGRDSPAKAESESMPSDDASSGDLAKVVSASARAKFRGHHPPGVWEAHKNEIRRLYIDRAIPLREVRAIMREKGFIATEKMYKDKFAKWGFTKNNRRRDGLKGANALKHDGLSGRSTPSHHQDKALGIKCYFADMELSRLEILGVNQEWPLPGSTWGGMPPFTTPDPVYVQPPGYYNVREVLFKCFQHLGERAGSNMDPAEAESAFSDYPRTKLYRHMRHLRDAVWLFEEGYNAEAGALMQRAFGFLHLLVTDPSPWAMCDLLMVQMACIRYGQQELLWKYLMDYSAIQPGPVVWIPDVCKTMYEFFRSNSIETCLDFLADVMSVVYPSMMVKDTRKNVESFLRGMVNSKSRHRYHIRPIKRFSDAIENPSLSRINRVLGPGHSLLIFLKLFNLGYDSKWQDHGILDLATELQKSAKDLDSRRLVLRALAYFHMGRWQRESLMTSPQYGYAKQYMKQALDLTNQATFGGHSGGVLREVWEDMKLLEAWHRWDGDVAAADQVAEKRRQALSKFVGSLKGEPEG